MKMIYPRLLPVSLFCRCFFLSAVLHAQFTAVESPDGIEILENGKKVLFYQVQPKSLQGKYERAGYIHPLYSMEGNVLTEDFPDDHPHHHGIFWAWHQIILNNKQIADGWTSDSISWQVVKAGVRKDQNRISIIAQLLWTVRSGAGIKTDIVKENTTITVSSSPDNQRTIDCNIHLSPLVDSLKIGGSDDAKGYGGFCLRLKLPEDIAFVSNDSLITAQETAVTAGPVMDFHGSFDGPSSPK